MGRTSGVKSVHLRFPENVHRVAKMNAAALGKTLSDYLAQLIIDDDGDQDIEEISAETIKAIKAAAKDLDKNGGQELHAFLKKKGWKS